MFLYIESNTEVAFSVDRKFFKKPTLKCLILKFRRTIEEINKIKTVHLAINRN